MTRRQRVLVFVLASVFGLAGMATMAFVVWQQVRSMLRPAPATVADRRLVLTAADLVPFGAPPVEPKAEHFTSLRQFDGSRHLQYEYELEPTEPGERRIYLQSITFVQPHTLGARQMYQMQRLGVKAGTMFGGDAVKNVEAPELLPGGGDRYAAYITGSGQRIGNLFILREGRIVHSVILVGFVFDKPEDVQKLLEPMLAESRRRAR